MGGRHSLDNKRKTEQDEADEKKKRDELMDRPGKLERHLYKVRIAKTDTPVAGKHLDTFNNLAIGDDCDFEDVIGHQ